MNSKKTVQNVRHVNFFECILGTIFMIFNFIYFFNKYNQKNVNNVKLKKFFIKPQ
jgi:hypothetical protein